MSWNSLVNKCRNTVNYQYYIVFLFGKTVAVFDSRLWHREYPQSSAEWGLPHHPSLDRSAQCSSVCQSKSPAPSPCPGLQTSRCLTESHQINISVIKPKVYLRQRTKCFADDTFSTCTVCMLTSANDEVKRYPKLYFKQVQHFNFWREIVQTLDKL